MQGGAARYVERRRSVQRSVPVRQRAQVQEMLLTMMPCGMPNRVRVWSRLSAQPPAVAERAALCVNTRRQVEQTSLRPNAQPRTL